MQISTSSLKGLSFQFISIHFFSMFLMEFSKPQGSCAKLPQCLDSIAAHVPGCHFKRHRRSGEVTSPHPSVPWPRPRPHLSPNRLSIVVKKPPSCLAPAVPLSRPDGPEAPECLTFKSKGHSVLVRKSFHKVCCKAHLATHFKVLRKTILC